jgi:hypothetical protein
MSHQSDRRNFLKRGIGAGLCAVSWTHAASGKSPNGKIHHAAIGVGGKGWSDVMAFASHPQVVIASATLETGTATMGRRRRHHDYGLPLSSRRLEAE